MKLTEDQKIEAYTYCILKVLEYSEFSGGDPYVCNNLCSWLKEHNHKTSMFDDDQTLEYFPEFLSQKPKSAGGAWWPFNKNNLRIAALKKAIALTEQLKK